MDHSTNIAQRAADAIKRRREVAAELRLVAELVEDGLPAPLSVRPWVDGMQIQVDSEHVADWLLLLDLPARWTPSPHADGEHLEAPLAIPQEQHRRCQRNADHLGSTLYHEGGGTPPLVTMGWSRKVAR